MSKFNFDLKKIPKGTRLKVIGFHSPLIPVAYRRRLIAMGLLPNTEFTLTDIAPLGDPIRITFRNASLVLRKDELNLLTLSYA